MENDKTIECAECVKLTKERDEYEMAAAVLVFAGPLIGIILGLITGICIAKKVLTKGSCV